MPMRCQFTIMSRRPPGLSQLALLFFGPNPTNAKQSLSFILHNAGSETGNHPSPKFGRKRIISSPLACPLCRHVGVRERLMEFPILGPQIINERPENVRYLPGAPLSSKTYGLS